MARLINTRTEVVVRVSDEKATRLGSEWASADEKSAEAATSKAGRKRTSSKSA